ncbi:MAG: hypothetical protein OXD44_02400, partial [Gammaproteobacteria bacterium]|nr:hypothetical protein [Gammaproteobacteria bacterium]
MIWNLTHGRAAKLLNVYMKEFLFSEIKCKARKVVHPPVDNILLEALREKVESLEREIIERQNNGNHIANDGAVRDAICKPGK